MNIKKTPEKSQSLSQVLVIAGHDPTGGAGIQADIESIAANGAHACTVISCLTSQNSCQMQRIIPQPSEQILEQVALLRQDHAITAIKLGLLPSSELIQSLAALMQAWPQIPVVFDPVLASGTGSALLTDNTVQAIRQYLLPQVTLLTPNSLEARQLSGQSQLDDCAQTLLTLGCQAVLITGTHEQDKQVIHRLYQANEPTQISHWSRLAADYHGSGCTLAAAIAARLAQGESLTEAVQQGQAYSWQTLTQSICSGRCQHLPNRLFQLKPWRMD